MKKAISLILALVLCLGLCACGQDTPGTSTTQNPGGSENPTPSTTQTAPSTPTQTEPKPLADFNILGEWIIADDGLTVITFNEDGTCAKEGEAAAKYKVDTEIAVLTIYYSTPQSYNIEKVGEYYHLNGEHFLLREADIDCLNEMRYEKALALLNSIDTYFEFEQIAVMQEAYALLADLEDYKDVPNLLSRFTECTLRITDYHDGTTIREHIYNMQGDLVAYFTNGSVYCTNTYDENGNLIRVDYVDISKSGKEQRYHRTYEYNDAGQLVRHEYQGKYCWTYEYDASKNQVIEYYTFGGELQRTITSTYAAGLVVKEYIDFGDSHNEVSYTYDENGMLVEEIAVSSENENVVRYTYAYDENGNLIAEKCTYESNGETTYEETTYTYSTVYIYTPPQP